MLAFSRFQRDFVEAAPEIRTVGQAEFAPRRPNFTAGKRCSTDLKAKVALGGADAVLRVAGTVSPLLSASGARRLDWTSRRIEWLERDVTGLFLDNRFAEVI